MRDAWQALVVPNQLVFIGLLVVFEATVGLLVLSGGRRTQAGLWGALLMHIGLLPFGWIITTWSSVMLVTLSLLLRAERRHQATAAAPLPAAAGIAAPAPRA